jgi:hypothetical protein
VKKHWRMTMEIRHVFILYLYYELIAMYIDDFNKNNADEYDEKALDIWGTLTNEEINLLNSRGWITSINDLIEANNKILSEELYE